MIRYNLVCKKGHEFDGWFKDSRAYDGQKKRGLVTCPECGTAKVDKALMAPNLGRRQNKKADRPAGAPDPATTTTEKMAMPVSPEHREMLEFMRKVRREVEAKAEYVGPRFAEEARKIHYEETEARGIYGEASLDEAKALLDEGIGCLPLPVLPEDKN